MKTAAAAGLVAAVTVGVYWGALSSGFVGDDFMILHRLRSGAPVLGFLRGEFFQYYRPLGFLAHALDWRLAGANATQFHATNLVLHAVSAVLVLLIGRALAPQTIAGPLAAVLFALHASNHEAVVWISARFDLLATLFSLLAVWLLVRDEGRARLAPAAAFFCAVLSKESAVGLPIAAAGFAAFRLHASVREAVERLFPWLATLVLYSVLRRLAGGISTIGGAAKLPKLATFGAILVITVFLAGGRWTRLRRWLEMHGAAIAIASAAAAGTLAAIAAASGGVGLVADKLAVAGFVIVNLISPVVDLFDVPFYLDPGTTGYWAGGVAALAGAGVLVAVVWRPMLRDDRLWFLGSLLIAALLPISALTEGTRYLYLPSAALALMVGMAIAELTRPARQLAIVAATAFTIVSSWQIVGKVKDWQWAGRLTSDGAHIVDAALAPACGEGHVVFLTQPVALRSVYTHFLYETFELPRGCMPARFDVLSRLVRIDGRVEARRQGQREIVLEEAVYRGNLSLSADLRHFDPPIRSAAPVALDTPLGRVRAEREGNTERVTLSLAPDLDPGTIHFFYYSDGAIHTLLR